MSADDLILGVDGGGTKTVAWLARRGDQTSPTVIGKGTAGSSNCRSIGFDRATDNLQLAIDAAWQDAKQTPMPIASACLSLAGADRPIEQQQFRAWADLTQLADQVIITNDALPVLYAASPSGIGIALIAGTGSIAIGRNSAGDTARCGGWGSVMGDEGSGYQIAVAGLKAAVRAADGRGPQTILLPNILSHYQLDNANELIPVIYSPESDRASIAELAPIIFAASDAGDTVAQSIIDQAATDLKKLVATLATRLGLATATFPLAISGGVLLSQANFVDQIQQQLAAANFDAIVTRVQDPVAGAINLACGMM